MIVVHGGVEVNWRKAEFMRLRSIQEAKARKIKDLGEKVCPICHNVFDATVLSPERRSPSYFKRRKCCSKECADIATAELRGKYA